MQIIKFNDEVMVYLKLLLANYTITTLAEDFDLSASKMISKWKRIYRRIRDGYSPYDALWTSLVDPNVEGFPNETQLKSAFRNTWKVFRAAFLNVEGIESLRDGFVFD